MIKEYSGVIALVILAILGALSLAGVRPTSMFGSATACTDGYTCVTNLEIQGNSITDGTASSVGTTTSAGNVVITTSDTATSSLLVGCIQTTATSTVTPVKLLLYASTSITASASFGGGTQQGFTTWGYGKCPRI